MGRIQSIGDEVRGRTYRFTLHAAERMTARKIAVTEVEEALPDNRTEVIEDYPDDPRGPSCLLLGISVGGRALHIQCTYPPKVVIITAYEPDPAEWIDLRKRRET